MQLYIVDYPISNQYAEASPIPVEYDYDKMDYCPECGSRVSGGYWLQPREVVLNRHRAPDFLYTYCDNVPFVVTERVLEGFRSAGLTGLRKSEKIESVRFQRTPKQDKYLPDYFHIEVVRSRITIDHQHSVIKYGNRKDGPGCPLCRQVPATYDFFRNLSLKMEQYEGYDIFQTYELCNQLFVSQRFVDMAEACGLTNLRCKKVQQYKSECWDYVVQEHDNN